MSNKVLSLLLGFTIITVGVIGYLVFGEYQEYSEKDSNVNESNEVESVLAETEIKASAFEEVASKEKATENDIKEETDSNLNTSVTIDLKNMNYLNPDMDEVYSYGLEFILNLINHTDKDIKGFVAELYFYDMFDELIYTIDLKYEWDVLPSKENTNFVGNYELNQFRDADMRFYNIPVENLKMDYKIKSIVFTDGTKIDD